MVTCRQWEFGVQDIWALGVTVYEAITGDSALPSRRGAAYACAAGDASYPWEVYVPRSLLDSGHSRLVLACLARDSAARPTAAAVQSALGDVKGANSRAQ